MQNKVRLYQGASPGLYSSDHVPDALRVHPSGLYAWLKQPFSKRDVEDQSQTGLIKGAWEENHRIKC